MDRAYIQYILQGNKYLKTENAQTTELWTILSKLIMNNKQNKDKHTILHK